MSLLLAALVSLAAFASVTALVLRIRPRPLALAMPLALAVLVAWNALALQALSWATAVTASGVAAAQAVPVAAWLALARRNAAEELRRGVRRLRRSAASLGIAGLVTLPLLVLTALSAARYAPQNWDSMTYHLARVAHWIQNASVEAYRTHVPRQNALGPGAEYLLLVLQVISRSDALANFVQWSCFGLVIWSAPSLGRLAGVPRAASPWLAPVVASIPMAVLQASTTQNDLVAAVLCVALVAAAAPFLHAGRPRWAAADLVLLGAVGAAALLVKVTALLVAGPVLVLGAVAAVRALPWGGGATRRLAALAAATVLTAAIAAPHVLRLGQYSGEAGAFVYPGAGEWADRATNVLRGLAHHVPAPPGVVQVLGISARDSRSWPEIVFRLQEDYAGNPAHVALLVALLALAVVRWPSLHGRARASVLAGLGAWVLFHVILRDNIWVSRLQTPAFVVIPILLSAALAARPARAVVGERPRGRKRAQQPAVSTAGPGVVRWMAPGAAALLLAYGTYVAVRSSTRPPLDSPPWASQSEASYYVLRPDVAPEHARALAVAEQIGCRRIGLDIGEDSFDYPLTWRAMQRGIEVRHVFFDTDATWPCITVSDTRIPPRVSGADWLRASRQVFVSPLAVSRR